MPHHNPPHLTELMKHLLLFICGASKALSQVEIARRLIFECPPDKARKALHYSLNAMADAGLILRVKENSRVVRYSKVSYEVPIFVLKDKGRPSSIKFRVARIEASAPDGSKVTMLKTGFLTKGGVQVQNGKHDVTGIANDEQERDAPDAGRRIGAGE